MVVRREKRNVFTTSDGQEFADEAVAKLHENRFQLRNLFESTWFYGTEPSDVVDTILDNSDRVMALLKENIKLRKAAS